MFITESITYEINEKELCKILLNDFKEEIGDFNFNNLTDESIKTFINEFFNCNYLFNILEDYNYKDFITIYKEEINEKHIENFENKMIEYYYNMQDEEYMDNNKTELLQTKKQLEEILNKINKMLE